VVSFAIANVRLGDEQLPVVFWLRVVMLGVSIAIALMAIRAASRLPRLSPAPAEAAHR
jgi:hypothetical protein